MSEINVGTAVAYLTMKDAGFAQGIAQAESALSSLSSTSDSLGHSLSIWSSALGSLGASLTTTFTLPIAKLAQSAIQTSMDLDTAMSQVRATMAITRDSTGELSDEVVNSSEIFQKFRDKLDVSNEGLYNTSEVLTLLARQLGRDTVFSAEEAADAINVLAMAGYDTNQIILALPEVLNLAAAGSLDIADAADYATGIMAGFNMEADEMSGISNILAAMASNAKGSVSDFGQGLSTVAGMASVTNQSIEDVSVALAILGNHNVAAAEGGNALARALRRLYQPTDAAAVALDELGVSIYDAEGNARALPDVLLDLNGALSHLTEQEYAKKISTIFGAVSSKTAPFLINDVTTAWEGLDIAINNSMGTAELSQVEFNKMIRELVANYKKAGGNVEKFYEDMQEYLHLKYNLSTAAAEETLEKFVGLMQSGKTSAKDFQEALGNIGGAASQMARQQLDNLQGDITLLKDAFAELQVVLVGDDGFLRTIVQTITEVVNAFASMSQAQRDQVVQIGLVIAALGPALLVISKILSVLSNIATALEVITSLNPLIAALVGIVGMLAIGFEEAYNSSEDFRGLLETIGGQLETLQDGFKHLWEEIKNDFQPVWDNFKDTAKEIVAEDLFPTFSNVLGTIWQIFEDWKPVLSEVAQLLADIASDYVLPAISEVFSTICDLINDNLPAIESLSSALATMASEVVLPALRLAIEGICTAIEAVWPYLKELIGAITEEFAKIITNIATGITNISNALSSVDYSNVAESWNNLKRVFELLDTQTESLNDGLTELSKILGIVPISDADKQGQDLANAFQTAADIFAMLIDEIVIICLWLEVAYNNLMIFLHPLDNQMYKDNIVELREEIGRLNDSAREAAQSIADDIGFSTEGIEKNLNTTKENLSAIVGSFDNTTEKIDKNIEDFGKVFEFNTQKTTENTDTLTDRINQWSSDFTKTIQGMQDDLDKGVDEFLGTSQYAKEEGESYLAGYASKTNDFSIDVFNTVSGLASSTADLVIGSNKDNSDKMKSFYSNNLSALAEYANNSTKEIDEYYSDWLESTGTFTDDVSDELNDLADSTGDIGKDTIKNLQDGMEGQESSLKTWLSGIASWISEKLNNIKSGFNSLREARNDYDGSYANGLSYVPYNGFIAQLHEGERILTKEENREYSSGSNGSGGDTFNFYNTQPDPYEYARQMKRAKKELLLT